jgi:cell division protein FtsQ
VSRFRLARRKPKRGAEVRALARARTLSRRDWLELAAVVLILSLIVAGVYKLRDPDFMPLKRVHFEDVPGNAAHAELRAAVARRLKGNFFTVDLQAIEQALTGLGWVKSASVRRQWPGALSIEVEKHVPIARWGEDAALNRAGQIFEPQRRRALARLPVLHGPRGSAKKVLTRFRQLSNTLAPAGLNVRALVQDQRRAWHLLLDNGIPVAIGRGNPIARVARFARVYSQVLASRAEHIERVDLRYTNGLAVAWRRPDDSEDAASKAAPR